MNMTAELCVDDPITDLSASIHEGLADLHPNWEQLAASAGTFFSTPTFLGYADRGHGRVFRVEVTRRNALRAAATGWLAEGNGRWLPRGVLRRNPA